MKRKSKRISKKAAGTNIRILLPDLDQAKVAVLNSLGSPESQRGYQHAIDEFIGWYCSEPRLSFNKTVVTRYRIHLETRLLTPGTINVIARVPVDPLLTHGITERLSEGCEDLALSAEFSA